MSSHTTHRPIPYQNSSSIKFIEEEFIDRFPDCDNWLIYGMMQMNTLFDYWRNNQYDHYKKEREETVKAVLSLLSLEQLEWLASRCHFKTPYGEIFHKELAERLLIQNP